MYSNEQKAKFTLAGIAVGASTLALVSFALVSWHQPGALEIVRVLEVTMSGLLLFGIFGAEVRHKGPILLAWIITTIAFCVTILFILNNAYVGEVFYVIITEFLLVGMMYIAYRAYCEVDVVNENFGWTHTTYPANIGLQLSHKSVDLKPKDANQSVIAKPPPYEEQNVPNVAVY